MAKLIFDLDGVIITYEKNFAEAYAAEFGVDVANIYYFFANDYHDCAIGRSALRDKIEKYVSLWGWRGDAESLIRYWFDSQSTVDTRLLDLIAAARRSGHECYVASDQDATRSAYVRRLVDLDRAFDGSFFSCDVGATKADGAFFECVLRQLGCVPGDDFEPAFSSRFVSA
jgi:putative hydrolase of the HAD superfamily